MSQLAESNQNETIRYIIGMITLNLSPPNGFQLEPKIEVDGKPALLERIGGEQSNVWKYLAVVGEGKHNVSVELGSVTSKREVSIKGTKTISLDFIFSDSP